MRSPRKQRTGLVVDSDLDKTDSELVWRVAG